MFNYNKTINSVSELMDANLHWIKTLGPINTHPIHPRYLERGIDPPGHDGPPLQHKGKVSLMHLVEFTLAERYFSITNVEHIPDMIHVLNEWLSWQERNQHMNDPKVQLNRQGTIMLIGQLQEFIDSRMQIDLRLQKADTPFAKLKRLMKI